jgi:hypothetical protein
MNKFLTRIAPGQYELVVQRANQPALIKRFENKEIFLPDEIDAYKANCLNNQPNTIWLGITGWTKPRSYFHEMYGTSNEKGIYEKLVLTLLTESITFLKEQGVNVDLRHGASAEGVDKAAMEAMNLLGIGGSGVNCLDYLEYVEDNSNGGPVLVATTREDYHALYGEFNQVLLVTGGSDAAYNHDWITTLRQRGKFVESYSLVADLIQTVSDRIVQSRSINPATSKLEISNAAALVRESCPVYSGVPTSLDWVLAETRFHLYRHAMGILDLPMDSSLIGDITEQIHSYARDNAKKTIPTVSDLQTRIKMNVDRYHSIK